MASQDSQHPTSPPGARRPPQAPLCLHATSLRSEFFLFFLICFANNPELKTIYIYF